VHINDVLGVGIVVTNGWVNIDTIEEVNNLSCYIVHNLDVIFLGQHREVVGNGVTGPQNSLGFHLFFNKVKSGSHSDRTQVAIVITPFGSPLGVLGGKTTFSPAA